MITDIISSFKGDLVSNIASKFGIGPDKAVRSVEIAKDKVTGTLKSEAASGNFSELKSALSGSQTGTENGIIDKIIHNYLGDLTEKLGLSSAQASSIANFVIPFIFNKIGNRTKGEGEMDESNILSLFGGEAKGNIKAGIGEKLGGLFGSK